MPLNLEERFNGSRWRSFPHRSKWDDPAYGKVGNILLSRIMGAETVLEGEGYSTTVKFRTSGCCGHDRGCRRR